MEKFLMAHHGKMIDRPIIYFTHMEFLQHPGNFGLNFRYVFVEGVGSEDHSVYCFVVISAVVSFHLFNLLRYHEAIQKNTTN